jgi:hypothetical protein
LTLAEAAAEQKAVVLPVQTLNLKMPAAIARFAS